MSTETIIVETKGRVGVIRFNRPQALNALNAALVAELNAAIDAFEADANIGCILITGSEKAFAAGADIKEMADKTYHRCVNLSDFGGDKDRDRALRASRWSRRWRASRSAAAASSRCRPTSSSPPTTPSSASRRSSSASFRAIGGTQRLTHAVGKAKAMDLILTGRMMDAAEAERAGLVARVVPAASLMDEAMKVAETIAGMSLPSVYAAKEAVNRAFETSLAEGVRFERRVFHALFATEDQKEGMAAFVEKRPAKFKNK